VQFGALPGDNGHVCGEGLPEKSNAGKVEHGMMHVHGKYKSARYKEGLRSHCWRIAFVEVYFPLTIRWDARIVCEIFRDKHGTLERTGRHTIPFELFIRVRKIGIVVVNLLGTKDGVQVLV